MLETPVRSQTQVKTPMARYITPSSPSRVPTAAETPVSQLLLASQPPQATETAPPYLWTIGAQASIAQAAALMVYEQVDTLTVLGQRNAPIGMLSATAILRWLAQTNGFVL